MSFAIGYQNLGVSGFELLDLISSSPKKEIYHSAHPVVPDAVMNYDRYVSSVSDEPDCSPHQFHILALGALYQKFD